MIESVRMRWEGRIVFALAVAFAIAATAMTPVDAAFGQVAKAPGGNDDRDFAHFEPLAARPAEIALEHLASGGRELQRAEKLSRKAPGARESKKAAFQARSSAAYSQAAAEFGMALQLDPELAPAHAGLGTALRGLEHYEDALAAFAGGLHVAPENEALLQGWTISLLALGRADEAISAHETLTETRPEQAGVLLATVTAWLAERLEHADGATDPTASTLAEWLPGRSE